MRRYVAEAVGTYLLVLVGTGAIIVEETYGILGHVGIAIAFGLVVMTMIYALGEISGAHFNPAVSFAFWLARRSSQRHMLAYATAQCLGALAASLTLELLAPPSATMGATLPTTALWQAWILEVLLTFALMYVIISVATGAKETGLMAGVAIGAAVTMLALFGGPLTGASMNPARSLGPALVSGRLEHLWIYLTAPFAGAALAVLLFRYTSLTHWRDMMLKTKVLFLCTGNSARSQMAEAFLREIAADRFEAHSAGLDPKPIHPLTKKVMAERGIDLSGQHSKDLASYMGQMHFGYLITVCAQADRNCPSVFPGMGKRLHWDLDDPAAAEGTEEQRLSAFRRVRDEIETLVRAWVDEQACPTD